MNVSKNDKIKLSDHFTLGEMTVTTYHTDDGNIPNRVAIENMTNLCEKWLEELRFSYNFLYCLNPGEDYETSEDVQGIRINSGYRSPEVNQKCGGAKNSNHLTGCAVDIHCAGKEQAIRHACILLERYAMPASCWTSRTGRNWTSMSSSSRSAARPSGCTSR